MVACTSNPRYHTATPSICFDSASGLVIVHSCSQSPPGSPQRTRLAFHGAGAAYASRFGPNAALRLLDPFRPYQLMRSPTKYSNPFFSERLISSSQRLTTRLLRSIALGLCPARRADSPKAHPNWTPDWTAIVPERGRRRHSGYSEGTGYHTMELERYREN